MSGVTNLQLQVLMQNDYSIFHKYAKMHNEQNTNNTLPQIEAHINIGPSWEHKSKTSFS